MFFDRRSKFIEIGDIPLSKRHVVVDSSNVNDSDNYQLSVSENVVEVDSSDIGAACQVYLPDVTVAAGIAFDIYTPDAGSAGNKVEVFDESGGTQQGNDLDADGDYVTVISTGRHWRIMANSSA